MASRGAIRGMTRLPESGPWPTEDPFLFAVHHDDSFPPGDPSTLGPADRSSLRGRNMGADFGGKDGWSMYHGEVVPGFPKHPHRGFETVTIARSGLVDHSDSLGAAGWVKAAAILHMPVHSSSHLLFTPPHPTPPQPRQTLRPG
jgi:hypothetical protein